MIIIFGHRISYQAQSGDTIADILSELSTGINSADYTTFSATSSVDGNILTVTTNFPYRITTETIAGDNYIFKTGDFANIHVLSTTISLLLYVNESNVEYPEHETLQSQYDYDTLTTFNGQLRDYLSESGYSLPSFPLPLEYRYSTTEITDAPFFPSTSSRAVLDEINSRIIFSNKSSLKKNEIINLLYK